MPRTSPLARAVAVACAALLAGALTACSSSTEQAVQNTGSAVTSAASPTAGATESAETAAGTTSDTTAAGTTALETAGTAAGGERTISTAYGDVTVPATATRVAAMSYDTPWQLQSLGVTPIAVQDYGKWIEQFTPEQQALVAGIPTIGSFGELNFEAVAAADPDLIVGDADEIDEATFKRLSEIAPTAIVKGYSRGDWQAITTALAEATGTTAAADTSRTAYESTLNRLRSEYADVIAANTWVHFSLGDDASQFSIQQPTGAIGNLVVNELGLLYGAGVPTDYSDGGYGSYPLEQLGTIFAGVTVALYPLNSDGSISPAIKAIQDNELFKRLEVAKSGKVFGLTTSITDFVTANEWLEELEATVLSKL